ncbi:MAG: elongation factor G [Saprospiraceae bacterium]|nr:elongation factor G [Saprospiraceae bacterium]MBK8511145.1 elongation factor G [Saprospiraceae bacterium]MBK9929980.1 elongation factor G [Saprospiraceae bacterium]
MNFESKDIRNVVLLGHAHSGKTSLIECMLFEAHGITRRGNVEEGNTVSDYNPLEQERQSSLFSSLEHSLWKDSKINIIDTPGSDDFIGEVIAALKVADTAVMVLNGAHGVEVGTEIMWEYVQNFATPSIFVINQLDHEKSDYDATMEQAISRFGPKVLPIQYPINEGTGFHSIVDALRMVVYEFPADGGKPIKKPIPESEKSRALEMHNKLVEAAAENEEELMARFFDQGTLSEEDLAYGLRVAIAHQSIYPVFCASAKKNMGTGRIMGFINDICPSPAVRPAAPLEGGGSLACDVNDQTTIFIYKTLSEPKVGNVSYFKVYSGKLKSGDELINANNRNSERFGQLFIANGKNREPVDHLNAGDIGVVVKLKDAHTNNTLNAKGTDRKIEPIHFPEPRVRVAVQPPSKNDIEKLAKALHVIQEEDPTIIIEQSAELRQMLLFGQGQLHLDMVKHRLEKNQDLHMEFIKPRIPYRETITRVANGDYRHKKQSGGAGQFGEVHMRLEPYHDGMEDPADLNVRIREEEIMPWGGKLVFYWCIVGGAIDTKFSSAIKKGILSKMSEGPLTGSRCRDIRVCVYDGKMHPVDSNDMAFQLAGTMAFKNIFQTAGPQLLEPIYDLEVLCGDTVMGDIMGDLQTRRAIIMGMDSDGHYQKIKARVPLAELDGYSSTLRSLTQGKAKFTTRFAEYGPVPGDLQKKLMEEYALEYQEEHA